jgi:hypothetical protein
LFFLKGRLISRGLQTVGLKSLAIQSSIQDVIGHAAIVFPPMNWRAIVIHPVGTKIPNSKFQIIKIRDCLHFYKWDAPPEHRNPADRRPPTADSQPLTADR